MNRYNKGYKLRRARRRNYLPIDTGEGTTYKVKKGDSPWAVAYSRGMSLDEFYRLNPKARNGIYAGDQVTFVAPDTKSYRVKKGDYPWKIAQDNGISLEELYEYNPKARKMIYPNDELRIPIKVDTKKLALSNSNSNKAANNTSVLSNAQPAQKDTTKTKDAPINGGDLQEVVVKGNKRGSIINGGNLPEVVVAGKKPKKDLDTIYNGGNLPEVEIIGNKPKKELTEELKRKIKEKLLEQAQRYQNSSASIWDTKVPRSQASKAYDYRYDNALFDFGNALNVKNKKKLGGKLKRRRRLSI